MTAIAFDNNSLQTDNIIVSDINIPEMPDRDLSIFQIAHANKSKITNHEWISRTIVLKGSVSAENKVDFENVLDEFKGYLTGVERPLDVEYGGSTRRYIATYAGNGSLERQGGLFFADFELPFKCSSPFGVDVTPTSLVSVTGATTSPSTSAITVGGNANYQYPDVEVTVVAATNTAGATVSISNNNNGQVCHITRNWTAGDVVTLQPSTGMVKVNGNEVEFTGAIPIWNKGLGAISISDTFDSRTYNYDVEQLRYWL